MLASFCLALPAVQADMNCDPQKMAHHLLHSVVPKFSAQELVGAFPLGFQKFQ